MTQVSGGSFRSVSVRATVFVAMVALTVFSQVERCLEAASGEKGTSMAGVMKARTEADYRVASLAAVLAEKPTSGAPAPFFMFVVCQGAPRPLAEGRRLHLERWSRAFASNPLQFTDSYLFEIPVREGNTDAVLCLRSRDIGPDAKPFGVGQNLGVRLIRVGGVVEPGPIGSPHVATEPIAVLLLAESISATTTAPVSVPSN